MRYQQKPYWCGPAALQNALRVIGCRIGQATLARVLDTTIDGTDEIDFERALLALDIPYQILGTNDRSIALSFIGGCGHRPMIICVDNWQHWITVVAIGRDRVLIQDPSTEPWNKVENGSHWIRRDRLLKRWRAARRNKPDGTLYFGFAIYFAPERQTRNRARAASND